MDLLWVNLCELGVVHETRARRRREMEEAARTGGTSSQSHAAAHDPPKPVASVKETLQALSGHVRPVPWDEQELGIGLTLALTLTVNLSPSSC